MDGPLFMQESSDYLVDSLKILYNRQVLYEPFQNK